ncbi:MAG TPA: hypothetical protein PLS58_02375 [Bacteroidales bacterium]|jgi:hypothetical protein|nr:hypothetical protein [Bacteroidales bacterium]
MLIDVSANIGHWPFRQTGLKTCRELLGNMDRYGVETSVISNMNGIFYKDSHAANEELYREISSEKRFRGRFVPFAVINPLYAAWRHDLLVCSRELKFKGLRLYPQYHDYEITDPACIDMVRCARDEGMVIALTVRMVDSRLRSWMDLSSEWILKDVIPLIREVPDARYMILNVSGGIMLNDEDTALIRGTDMIFDTSGRNISDLGSLLKKYGNDKFAFGTHSPMLDYLTGLLRIEALADNEADESTREMLRSGNAKRLLGI